MNKETLKIGKNTYKVHHTPVNHILMDIDGQFNSISNRERLLINPFNGCSHKCLFCFTNNRFNNSTFRLFRENNIITVLKNIAEVLAKQLDEKRLDGLVYLSPSTDPFQLLNSRYNVTETILSELTKRNIPFALSTKGRISGTAIDYLTGNSRSFAEISILTLDDEVRKKLVRGEAISTESQLNLIDTLTKRGIRTIARIDPVYPYINDDKDMLKELIEKLKALNVRTIISSCAKIPVITEAKNMEDLKAFNSNLIERYNTLYNYRDSEFIYADINYRMSIFRFLKSICAEKNMDFRLCLEYDNRGISLDKRL